MAIDTIRASTLSKLEDGLDLDEVKDFKTEYKALSNIDRDTFEAELTSMRTLNESNPTKGITADDFAALTIGMDDVDRAEVEATNRVDSSSATDVASLTWKIDTSLEATDAAGQLIEKARDANDFWANFVSFFTGKEPEAKTELRAALKTQLNVGESRFEAIYGLLNKGWFGPPEETWAVAKGLAHVAKAPPEKRDELTNSLAIHAYNAIDAEADARYHEYRAADLRSGEWVTEYYYGEPESVYYPPTYWEIQWAREHERNADESWAIAAYEWDALYDAVDAAEAAEAKN